MEIDGQLLLFGGSLIAIFVLAALAKALGLGGTPRLTSAEQVESAANEVVDGYEVAEFVIDAVGASALARDAQDRLMLIKRHGNRFAGRILQPAASARQEGMSLVIDSGEARFGTVSLLLDNPEHADAWAQAINRLENSNDA